MVYLLVLLNIVLPLVSWRWLLPRAAARNQTQGLHDGIALRWDAKGLRVSTVNSDVVTPWSRYFRWREDGSTIVLYQADVAFQFTPMRVLATDAVAQLRRLATAASVRVAARS